MMKNRSTLKPPSASWAFVILLFLATTANTVSSAVIRGGSDYEGVSFLEKQQQQQQQQQHTFDYFTQTGYEDAEGRLYEVSPRVQAVGKGEGNGFLQNEQQLHRALSISTDACLEEEAEVDYFDIEILIDADEERPVPSNCTVEEAVMLGRDISQVIHDHGVDIAVAYDSVEFTGAVCPNPTTTTSRRRQLVTLTTTKFIFVGPAWCISCPPDNGDRRQLASLWFWNTFKPNLEQNLTDHITTKLVPKYGGCLGENPTINVTVEEMGITALTHCPTTDEYHDSYNLNSYLLSPPKSKCGLCTKLDWSIADDGTVLHGGDYVKREWMATHGVRVRAYPNPPTDHGAVGYAPDEKARILDTANPGSDADLGAPNEECTGGGPGRGDGGLPGTPGENCYPIGNVLIIQEGDQVETDDFVGGGTIRFDFDPPVYFADIGIMDVTTTKQRLIFTYANGSEQTFAFAPTGNNGIRRFMVGLENVVKLEVYLPKSGAVTEINYCPMCAD